MSLFKKKESHEKKVAKAYGKFVPERIQPFISSVEVADSIIISFKNILSLDLEKYTADDYQELLGMYMIIKLYGFLNQTDKTPSAIQNKYSKYLTTNEKTEKAIFFGELGRLPGGFYVKSESDYSVFENLFLEYKRSQIKAEQNTAIADKYTNDPEFGLVPEKPIYTAGRNGLTGYLDSLFSDTGEQLEFTRIGTREISDVNGIIDVYESKRPNGLLYKELFICIYSKKTSAGIPNGFSRKTTK